jgi:hypothetical protein
LKDVANWSWLRAKGVDEGEGGDGNFYYLAIVWCGWRRLALGGTTGVMELRAAEMNRRSRPGKEQE